MIKMIFASDTKGGIGYKGKLPWNCPEDLKFFKETTDSNAVLMGRETFDGLPFKNGLPNRLNYVITRNKKLTSSGSSLVFYEDDLGGVLDTYIAHGIDLFVMGGASIYEQALPYVDKIYHTVIDGDYECDTFFNLPENIMEYFFLEDMYSLSDKATVYVLERKRHV